MELLTRTRKAAQLNGTLYIYGGQATYSKEQKEDTWSNSPKWNDKMMCRAKPQQTTTS